MLRSSMPSAPAASISSLNCLMAGNTSLAVAGGIMSSVSMPSAPGPTSLSIESNTVHEKVANGVSKPSSPAEVSAPVRSGRLNTDTTASASRLRSSCTLGEKSVVSTGTPTAPANSMPDFAEPSFSTSTSVTVEARPSTIAATLLLP